MKQIVFKRVVFKRWSGAGMDLA